MKDLRSFLADAEARLGPVREVNRRVDSDLELSAIVRLLEDREDPITYFREVVGSAMPVIVGVHGNRDRIALALGVPVAEAVDHFLDSLGRGVPPVRVDGAPVKEVRMVGGDVDLGTLPIPRHAEKDGGPYLTCGVGIARDVEMATTNTGIYRMQVLGPNRMSLLAAGDLGAIIRHAHSAGRTIEVAVAVGHHPAFQVSSQAKIPRSVDSLEIAGAVMREPLAIVAGETIDVDVPAAAEIVIEGMIPPNSPVVDGPFGESPRYYDRGNAYQFVVSAITHRRDAIFVDINNVHREHPCLSVFPAREALLLSQVRAAYPHVRAVRIPERTAAMHAHISVDPKRPGEAKQILMVALGANPRLKHAVVVNEDVDITDDESVLWALATRFQADRDLFVVPYVSGTSMDASSYTMTDRYEPGDLRTQAGFDATIPLGVPFRERADRVPEAYVAIDVEEYLVSLDERGDTAWRHVPSGAATPV